MYCMYNFPGVHLYISAIWHSSTNKVTMLTDKLLNPLSAWVPGPGVQHPHGVHGVRSLRSDNLLTHTWQCQENLTRIQHSNMKTAYHIVIMIWRKEIVKSLLLRKLWQKGTEKFIFKSLTDIIHLRNWKYHMNLQWMTVCWTSERYLTIELSLLHKNWFH